MSSVDLKNKYTFYMVNFANGIEFNSKLVVFKKEIIHSTMFNVTEDFRDYLEKNIFTKKAKYYPEIPLIFEHKILEKLYLQHTKDFVDKIDQEYTENKITKLDYLFIEKVLEACSNT